MRALQPNFASVFPLAILSLLLFTQHAFGIELHRLRIAVASNFSQTAKRLSQEFEHGTGISTEVSTGSTGALYAQIVNGAPFDIFLSADEASVNRLIRNGTAMQKSKYTYACGQIALVRSTGSATIDEFQRAIHKGSIQRIAIANPKSAPYGYAANEALKHMLDSALPTRQLIKSNNVAQAYQLVASKQVDWGIVAATIVSNPASKNQLSHQLIPVEWHSPIRQTMALMKNSKNSEAKKAFFDFMNSPRAKKIIEASGYFSDESKCRSLDQ